MTRPVLRAWQKLGGIPTYEQDSNGLFEQIHFLYVQLEETAALLEDDVVALFGTTNERAAEGRRARSARAERNVTEHGV